MNRGVNGIHSYDRLSHHLRRASFFVNLIETLLKHLHLRNSEARQVNFDIAAQCLIALQDHVVTLPSDFVTLMFKATFREIDSLREELLLISDLVGVLLEKFVDELELADGEFGLGICYNWHFSGVGDDDAGTDEPSVVCHLQENVFSGFADTSVLVTNLRE